MQIGVVFPQTEYGNDPGAISAYAQTAEALGYTHVLAYDHVLGANPDRPGGWRGPYTYETPFHEPFVLFSYMAALTTRLSFITGILILPQRATAVVAKQAATLDVLSGGRFRLGIGVGWNQVEYVALNQDFHTRGRRVDEQIEVLRRLWTEPLVDFSGEFHTIPDAGINPLPVQRPIPVWFGGHADAVLRRLARAGAGWLPNYRDPAALQPELEKLAGFVAEQGRSMREIGIEPRLHLARSTPDSWGPLVESWRASGATHLSVNTMGCGFETPAAHLDALRRFAAAVGISG